MSIRALLHRSVRDRDGVVVLGQAPNLSIKVAVVAAILTVVTPGSFRVIPALVTFGAFFTWAWLELFDGTTPLRRILGGFVISGLLVAAVFVVQTNALNY